MSKQEITLVLEKREVVGKGLNGLKKIGQIPAVIHQPGSESLSVSGSFVELTKAYSNAGKHHPVVVNYGSKQLLTIIKDADFDPKKHMLRHVVFGVIDKNEKVETEVPIVLVGDAPAVKVGLLIHQGSETITIEALPNDLVDTIEVSVGLLSEVGDKIVIGDIKAPKGVTILTDPDFPVASVEAPRVQEEEPEEDTATTQADTTETTKE